MSATKKTWLARKLLRDERGLTTVEYVIVLCLVATAAITTWDKFGDQLIKKVNKSTQEVKSL